MALPIDMAGIRLVGIHQAYTEYARTPRTETGSQCLFNLLYLGPCTYEVHDCELHAQERTLRLPTSVGPVPRTDRSTPRLLVSYFVLRTKILIRRLMRSPTQTWQSIGKVLS